jgi:long-chain acyl-CoA synthetase
MERPWFKHYPKGVPREIDPSRYPSILELFEESAQNFRENNAFVSMGSELTYEDLNYLSADFASFLQNVAGLKKGDRVAIMMPNLLQYPIALFGTLRAGMTVCNVNPLYTPRELKHQLKDSGAKVIVILANVAHTLAEIIQDTDVKTVVVTEVGDMLGFPKSVVVNTLVKHVKKMVPKYNLPDSFSWFDAMDHGADHSFTPVTCTGDDIAFLQYTGGTTGVAKGAMLTHRNIVSNLLQIAEWMKPKLIPGQEIAICALPLYHIFSLTVNCLAFLHYGASNIMITNPRDIPGFIKTLRKNRFTLFSGLNTLYNALMNHPDFNRVNFSSLKVSVAGGMALQKVVAERWMKSTNSVLVEGYGLTETSPVATCNPIDGSDKVGTIGLPLPSTDIKLIDDNGKTVAQGEAGEICVKGPQVMKGYWQRPEDTAQMITSDGWLKTGDVGVMDEQGFTKIVDRKKDMILVSGFNVYPNEIEEVVASHPKVLEVAAVGVPDERSTEAVKIFVVARDPSLTKDELLQFCRTNLTGYKMPKQVEFRKELPKTNVGKILRRELRDSPTK